MMANWKLELICSLLIIYLLQFTAAKAYINQKPGIPVECPVDQVCEIEEMVPLITNEEGMYHRRYSFPKFDQVSQLKLSFEGFNLAQPSSIGNCETDSLTITGSPSLVQPLTLCGSMMELIELYFDYGSSETIFMDINIRSANSMAKYNISPSFIRQESSDLAPPFCLQNLKGSMGQVKSFNFGFQQLNLQQYYICMQPDSGCGGSIKWRECVLNSFLVTGNLDSPIGALSGHQCETDWIEIFGGKRHCGTNFLETISTTKPYMLRVNFDETESSSVGPGELCISNNPAYTCMFVQDPSDPTKNICQCALTDPSGGEAFNTGFCLEYNVL